MKTTRQIVSVALVTALLSLGVIANTQYQRPYRTSDRIMQQLIQRIEMRTNRFKIDLGRALDRSPLDNTRRVDNISQLIADFEQSTNQLRSRFSRREQTLAEAGSVLAQAALIDNFMERRRLQANAERDWRMLRSDLNRLASYYNIAWNWNSHRGNDALANRLTGTYRLNTLQSDNARLIVDRAVRRLPYYQRQQVADSLLTRVEAPEMIALERQGRMVTLVSSRASQVTFEADGRQHLEQYPNARRTSRVIATLVGDRLTINSTGDRATDYSVTFDPIGNGDSLRVTRSLYVERLTQPVVIRSVYESTSHTAQWNIFSAEVGSGYPGDRTQRTNDAVPSGTMLTARLNTDLRTDRAKAGDRFTLTVLSPSMYEGAVIEGYVANVDRGGRITGRTEMAINLDQIRLRSGQTYRFDGAIESVRALNGEMLSVDSEGSVQADKSQTTRTIERTAIGSAIGAIIGAIAGGGKGAAIGAAVGAGTGAGSVYVQGRDRFELLNGSELTIKALAPSESARR